MAAKSASTTATALFGGRIVKSWPSAIDARRQCDDPEGKIEMVVTPACCARSERYWMFFSATSEPPSNEALPPGCTVLPARRETVRSTRRQAQVLSPVAGFKIFVTPCFRMAAVLAKDECSEASQTRIGFCVEILSSSALSIPAHRHDIESKGHQRLTGVGRGGDIVSELRERGLLALPPESLGRKDWPMGSKSEVGG